MNNIDLHLHIAPKEIVCKEGDLSFDELKKSFGNLLDNIKNNGTEQGLVIIMDVDFLKKPHALKFLKEHKDWFKVLRLCFMFDFRRPEDLKLLDTANELGAKAIKFHPYLQNIAENDYKSVEIFAEKADKLGMFIVVDCAYGTRKLYKYEGIKLSGYLSEKVSCPVIIAHAGGFRALDALMVAVDTDNIYLDISFSLDYWEGSTVEQDIAFAVKNWGASVVCTDRIILLFR